MPHDARDTGAIDRPSEWLRLLFGLIVVFALFHFSALAIGSDRGQAGLIVGLLVVAATLTAERLLFRERIPHVDPSAFPPPTTYHLRTLGLGMPAARGLLVVSGVSAVLLLVVLVFSVAMAAGVSFFAGLDLASTRPVCPGGRGGGDPLSGLSLQSPAPWAIVLARGNGVDAAIRRRPPIPVCHDAVADCVGGVAPVRGVVVPPRPSVRVGRRDYWAPAVLHFVVQGTVKVLVFPGEGGSMFPVVWMVASAVVPWLSLLAARQWTTSP